MKLVYETPAVEIIHFSVEDVITTSGGRGISSSGSGSSSSATEWTFAPTDTTDNSATGSDDTTTTTDDIFSDWGSGFDFSA